MRFPSRSGCVRRASLLGWIVVLGYGQAHSAPSQKTGRPSAFDSFLEVDARFLDATQIAAARIAFQARVRLAVPCGGAATRARDRARCVVDTLFAAEPLVAVAEPGDPESSTVTSALVSQRGNCAALTALALAVSEGVDVPMEAVVFPRHVVVRAPGNEEPLFELLTRGSALSMSQLRTRLGVDGAQSTRVTSREFLAFYLDNLAVRFAEAGEAARADAMFEQAIEAAPRLARTRFNYGTFLLGESRLQPAAVHLRRAVRLESRNAPAWANLGVVLARLGETTEARRCFDRALRNDPGNRIAAENLQTLVRDASPN